MYAHIIYIILIELLVLSQFLFYFLHNNWSQTDWLGIGDCYSISYTILLQILSTEIKHYSSIFSFTHNRISNCLSAHH